MPSTVFLEIAITLKVLSSCSPLIIIKCNLFKSETNMDSFPFEQKSNLCHTRPVAMGVFRIRLLY